MFQLYTHMRILTDKPDKYKAGSGFVYPKLMDLPASLSLSKLTNTKLGEEDPSQTLKPSLQGEVWLQLPQCPCALQRVSLCVLALCVCFLTPNKSLSSPVDSVCWV